MLGKAVAEFERHRLQLLAAGDANERRLEHRGRIARTKHVRRQVFQRPREHRTRISTRSPATGQPCSRIRLAQQDREVEGAGKIRSGGLRRDSAHDGRHAQGRRQGRNRRKRIGMNHIQMTQHLVGGFVGHDVHEDVIVPAAPELLSRLGENAHQAGRKRPRDNICHHGIALVFDQAAEFGLSDRTAAMSCQKDRRGVTAGCGQGEEIAMRRGPQAGDRVGELAGHERQQGRRRARRLWRAVEQLRDHGRVSSQHGPAIPPVWRGAGGTGARGCGRSVHFGLRDQTLPEPSPGR